MKNRFFSSYGTLLAGLVLGAGSLAAVQRADSRAPRSETPRTQGPAASATPILKSARQTPGTSDARNAAVASTTTLEDLRRLDSQFADLAGYVSPAVVHIRVEGRPKSLEGASAHGFAIGGEGSGFIYRSDGVIVTNDHVVGGFENVTVELKDGREFRGKVTRAEESDIAIVRIEAKDLPVLKIADSARVRPGEFAIAIGAPLGLQNSVTIGHVSAVGRASAIPDANIAAQGRFYPDLLQTDAAINPGNSGGPLVDIDGNVIGLNTGIYSLTGGSNGLGFAIPSNQVKLVADLLVHDGKLVRSQLGIFPEDVKEYRRKELGIAGGARVADVSPNSPAEKAGVQKDDIVLRVADQAVVSQMDVRNAMLRYRPGTQVDVEVLRGKEHKTFKVTLKEAPKTPVFERSGGNGSPAPDGGAPDSGAPNGGVPDGRVQELRKQMEKFLKERGFDGQGAPDESLVPPLGDPKRSGGPKSGSGHPQLGVSLSPEGKGGALVASVEAGSLAQRLGMKEGDLVTAFDGKPIASSSELAAAMAKVKSGERHRIRYVRKSSDAASVVERDAIFR